MESEKEYTVAIETTAGLDYLIMTEKPTDESVKREFELYQNDEAGQYFEGAKLLSWELVRED